MHHPKSAGTIHMFACQQGFFFPNNIYTKSITKQPLKNQIIIKKTQFEKTQRLWTKVVKKFDSKDCSI